MVINQRVITNISPGVRDRAQGLSSRKAQLNKSEMPHGMLTYGRKGPAENRLKNTQMISRLAIDPRDAEALISIYEYYEREIRAAAVSWFGNKHGLHEQAVNNILVAIGRHAGSYDPKSMDVSEWINQIVNSEARRLREALNGVLLEEGIERGQRELSRSVQTRLPLWLKL